MISTTTTTRTLINNNSSVEWQRRGLVILALLLFSIPGLTQTPELLMPDTISTKHKERDMTISADGGHLLYSVHSNDNSRRMIVELMKQGKSWGSPQVVSFSGQFKDIEPMFDPSGQRLFFASDRPMTENDESNDYNIWYVERERDGWGEPIALDTLINTEGDEFYPSISRKGTLYFTATKKEGKGKEDIYFSTWKDNSFQMPVSMDTAVNTATYEFNSFIDPDETYIIFSSYGRPDGLGGGDLYISYNEGDKWTSAVNLGASINSRKLDYCPFVSSDGKTFYFTSNRGSQQVPKSLGELHQIMDSPQNGFDNIYRISTSAIHKIVK